MLCDYLSNLANTQNPDKAHKKYALFGCIELKNSVRAVWAEHTRMGIEQLQMQLRPKIFQLMFVFDEQCSQFVCDAVDIIAKLDFPERWDTLMTDTVNMMRDDNHRHNYLCWSLIEANTKKYVWLERSDELFSEIIKVINELHGKLMYYTQGYLNQLCKIFWLKKLLFWWFPFLFCTKNLFLARNDNQGDPNLGIYLKIYKKLLQVFRHFSSQDLHPYIEDNLSAWLGILKGTLGAHPGGLTGNVMKIAGDGLEGLWFKCKGEAINCILLYSTKYQDDIMEMLQPFANEIWGVCQQNASGNTKILVNSLKYFRTFAQNEKFSGFFEQNMFEFFTKLLLPNFQPTEDAFDAFENEADSYVEALYDNVEICKRSEMAAGFLRTLSRYHNEKVQAIIFQVIGDYYNNEKSKGITNPTTEIVVLKLVFYSLVTGYRKVTGTSEITMSQEIITATYTNIVQPTLASVFNTIEQDPLGTYANVHQI